MDVNTGEYLVADQDSTINVLAQTFDDKTTFTTFVNGSKVLVFHQVGDIFHFVVDNISCSINRSALEDLILKVLNFSMVRASPYVSLPPNCT